MLGTSTLPNRRTVEVTNVSPFGFWLLAHGKEYFVDFDEYPAFSRASVLDIATVTTDAAGNLHWPTIDADIEIEALVHPESYPLAYR